jgi:hypothetical protein
MPSLAFRRFVPSGKISIKEQCGIALAALVGGQYFFRLSKNACCQRNCAVLMFAVSGQIAFARRPIPKIKRHAVPQVRGKYHFAIVWRGGSDKR